MRAVMLDLEKTPVEIHETLPVVQSVNQPYWQMATSANTRKAYQSDIRHFRNTGGLLPTTTEKVLALCLLPWFERFLAKKKYPYQLPSLD